jgi:hypothetical protein
MVMRFFFVPCTTGDIVSFASTVLNKAMEKQNAKIGECRKLSKICIAAEKNTQDEPLMCG